MRITFGTQLCGDLDAGSRREWLVTDGLGGYAMGTVAGLRTRRYHGLLVVADPRTPARRHLALAAIDPVVTLPDGEHVLLGVHEWASGAVSPDGYRYLERFDLVDGLPRWRWRVGDVVVERELAMRRGYASVAIVHRLVSGPPRIRLTLYPSCTWRDAHGERRADGQRPTTPAADGFLVEGAYRVAGAGWQPGAGEWWHDVYAREEAARGLNAVEDLWHPGRFTVTLSPGETHELTAWSGNEAEPPPPAADTIEAARRRGATMNALERAADQFIIEGPDVVAGYPWFGTWSRDTMTAYEGLFLATGRADEGRRLLLRYAETLSEGMLANTADTGRTEYNTVDATLWFLHAVERHVSATGDVDLAAALADPLAGVVAAHVAGTRYGVHADPADGLIAQGAEGYALTWMDARIEGVPVTPRVGKPVEVNALWVNGLAALAALFGRIGRDASELEALRYKATRSFAARFPAPRGWLFDVVDPDDAALRPNQLLAYSLPYAPLQVAPDTLAALAPLVTPLGLRSLAPADPAYQGNHRGDSKHRDLAYHQGTVWPWLIGPYWEVAVRSGTERAFSLASLEAHLTEWGLGSVSETVEGDAPHRGTGCPFQAWSVAEVLRVHQKLR
jgi:predicted glycogen debranching enzyme